MRELLDHASPEQRRVLEAVIASGSNTKAAKQLGLGRRTVDRIVLRVRMKAAESVSGVEAPIPAGMMLKGTSTLMKGGVPVMQWVKTTVDKEAQIAAMKIALQELSEDVPRALPVLRPSVAQPSLCTVYTLTDTHVGMLAWHEEGGADWDLKIAEDTLIGCFGELIRTSPSAETCVIAQLGDWMHYDGFAALTPTSRHVLDADGRFPKMVRVAVRILRRIIDMALTKHRYVKVLMAEGNHDMASSVWLRTLFAALYENEPRIEVVSSELPYYVYQHGRTMLSWHHGHLAKNEALPLIFAARHPKIWGDTTKRYCHTGHRHHVEEKEHAGMKVTQHPTLAASDAYSARAGWLSERQATSITYSDRHGEVARNTVTPDMLN